MGGVEPWGSMLPTQEERRSYCQTWLREALIQPEPRAQPTVSPLPMEPMEPSAPHTLGPVYSHSPLHFHVRLGIRRTFHP